MHLSSALRSRQSECQLHGPEGAAMLRGNAVHGNRRAVLPRAIAFVPLETVVGVLARERVHEGVARDLGNDSGGGDREALGVAVHDGARVAIEARRLVAV